MKLIPRRDSEECQADYYATEFQNTESLEGIRQKLNRPQIQEAAFDTHTGDYTNIHIAEWRHVKHDLWVKKWFYVKEDS